MNRRDWLANTLPLLLGGSALLSVWSKRVLARNTSASQPSNGQIEAFYAVRAGGIGVADVRYRESRENGLIAHSIKIETSGLVGAFRKSETVMRGAAAVGPGGDLTPVTYTMEHSKPGRTRFVKIDYANDGSIDALEVQRNGEQRSSKVAPGLRSNTIDPMTALAFMRAAIGRHSWSETGHELIMPVFDGRKRYDVTVTWLGTVDDLRNPFDGQAQKLAMQRTPIAGYDEDDDEWLKHRRGETTPLVFYTTADAQAVPYLGENPNSTVSQEAALAKYCTDAGCRLFEES